MGKVSEITITKGKTVKAANREEWVRLEFSVKALVDDQNDIEAAKAHLEGLIDGWLSSSLPSPTSAPQETLESVKGAFPPELRELLSFEQGDGCFVIKPRQFLGSEKFCENSPNSAWGRRRLHKRR
jgi:hypothetical protein